MMIGEKMFVEKVGFEKKIDVRGKKMLFGGKCVVGRLCAS